MTTTLTEPPVLAMITRDPYHPHLGRLTTLGPVREAESVPSAMTLVDYPIAALAVILNASTVVVDVTGHMWRWDPTRQQVTPITVTPGRSGLPSVPLNATAQRLLDVLNHTRWMR